MDLLNKSQVVFVVHSGGQSYLTSCIKSSKIQGNHTILIGNDSGAALYADEFFAGEEDCNNYKNFKSSYRHMSTNAESFELLCFKRYFLLLSVAKQKDLKHFWMVDSDVLLLENLNDLTNFLTSNGYKASLSSQSRSALHPPLYSIGSSPHLSFWTIEALENFVEFSVGVYETHGDILRRKYQYHLDNSLKGGICDMTILDLWSRSYGSVFNNAKAHLCGLSYFDHNINSSLNYESDDVEMDFLLRVKRIFRGEQGYYVWSPSLKREFKIGCLHFQGGAKILMTNFLLNKKLSRCNFLMDKSINYCKRIWKLFYSGSTANV
jgi:hypothetical protein